MLRSGRIVGPGAVGVGRGLGVVVVLVARGEDAGEAAVVAPGDAVVVVTLVVA